MITKKDLRALLSKGLTGKEAARLILEDNWLFDHGKEGFLSDRDVSAIKASLKTTREIEVYNSFVESYRLVDFTLKEAHIMALEIQRDLLIILHRLDTYLVQSVIDHVLVFELPAIATQKQYDELKEIQKSNRLKELYNLKEILDKRAGLITPEEIQEEWINGDEEGILEYLLYHLEEKYPDLWKQAVSEILEVLKSGQLKPASITGSKDQARLEKLWLQMREVRDELEEKLFKDKALEKKLDTLHKKEKLMIQELYQQARSQDSQEVLINSLQKLLDSSLSEDDRYQLLEYTFSSGEELYQAGLPEWIKDLDTFIPNLTEETAVRPLGMLQGMKVAIIQDPEPEDLDERGYYKDKDTLGLLTGLKSMSEDDKDEAYTELDQAIKQKLKVFLAYQAVVDAVSSIIGVNFSEDMEDWHSMTSEIVELYNAKLASKPRIAWQVKAPDWKPIDLEKLKPARKTISYIQERMAMSLGQGWQDAEVALRKEVFNDQEA